MERWSPCCRIWIFHYRLLTRAVSRLCSDNCMECSSAEVSGAELPSNEITCGVQLPCLRENSCPFSAIFRCEVCQNGYFLDISSSTCKKECQSLVEMTSRNLCVFRCKLLSPVVSVRSRWILGQDPRSKGGNWTHLGEGPGARVSSDLPIADGWKGRIWRWELYPTKIS